METRRTDPAREILWVVASTAGDVALWDLLKVGDTPQIAQGQWVVCGPIGPMDDEEDVASLIETAMTPPADLARMARKTPGSSG